ncbi:MAG: phosphoribosylformylglycinamidine synthase subunit PurQ, partial [Ferruginibacter sp.]
FYASEDVMQQLVANNQIVYTYCTEKGDTDAYSNPNGAGLNIAGICNESRNVFGMMPHPERACSNQLHNTDGKQVFQHLFGIS